jgi:molybdate transport system regulatory protein
MPNQNVANKSRLKLSSDLGNFLCDTRIRLLEAISTSGSISQAAKMVPLSYKAAWDAVQAMNNLAEQPIVVRVAGGKKGGGTQLTQYGQRLVHLYRALESEYQRVLDRIMDSMEENDASDFVQFQQLIQRIGMRSSARNQFVGRVVGLRESPVDYEVCVELSPGVEIIAVITRTSAEHLGLVIGKPVVALIKAPSVLILTGPSIKTTARNAFWGEVIDVQSGPVNSEVTIALPEGKAVCAVITNKSISNLGIKPGSQACAVFMASSVVLNAYN